MKAKPILTAVGFAAFFFVSCKNSGTSGLPIPKDAAIVVHINTPSLTRKLSWKEIQSTEWFQEMYRKSQEQGDSLTQKILNDPSASGVDAGRDFAFFLRRQGTGAYMVVEGHLKDAKAFEEIVKKNEGAANVQKDGDYTFVQEGKGSGLLTWNNSKFILMTEASQHGFDTEASTSYSSAGFTADSLKKFTRDLFDLSSDNSIESVDHYKTLAKEDGDMHFYMNTDQYYAVFQRAMAPSSVTSMMRTFNNFFKGNVTTGTLNFEDGKITVKSRQYMGEQMKAIMDKYKFSPVTTEQVNRIPSQDVVAALLANYPPEAAREFLRASGMDGFVNSFLGDMGLDLDQLIRATKGQMMLSVSDFKMVATPMNIPGSNQVISRPTPNVNIVLGLSVNDKASMDKLAAVAQNKLAEASRGSEDDASLLSRIQFKTNNDWFAVGNNGTVVDQFLAGGNTNKLPFADRMTGHPVSMYVDIQKIITGFKGMSGGPSPFADASMNMWQDILMTGGDYKDGVSTSEFTVNLVDKKTNSLKQLNAYAQKMYEAQKQQRQEMMRRMQGMDTDAPAEVVPGN